MGPSRSPRSTVPRFAAAGLLASALLLAACNGGPGTPDQAPTLAEVPDQRTTLGEPIEVQVTVSDEVLASVDLTATSSNQQVVPAAGLALTGTGGSRTLTITPGSTTPGTTVVTVSATDEGGNTGSQEFEVVVERPFSGEPALLTPLSGDPIGTAVAIDGAFAVAGGDEYAYVFELVGDAWTEREKLTPLQNGFNAVQAFGDDVAVDGSRVLVGAYETDGTATDQGVAFVFEEDADSFAFAGELIDVAPEADDRLGRSVGVSGDYLFAGAPGASEGDVRSGSVVVFVPGDPDGWTLLGKLTPSDAVEGTVFGDALDVSGDLLVVGDYANAQLGGEAGAAYVFEEDAGFWYEATKLAPAELEAGDQFGLSVAADDGWVLVGSWNDDDAALNAGAVYVFTDPGTGWEQVDKLVADDAAEHANFGGSVALDYPYAVVGAYLEDSEGQNAGAVYVFRHDGADWHQVAKLTSPEPALEAGFGWDVDISGEHLIVSQVATPTFTAVYRR